MSSPEFSSIGSHKGPSINYVTHFKGDGGGGGGLASQAHVNIACMIRSSTGATDTTNKFV